MPATLQFHLAPERMAQPECTSNLSPPPPSEGKDTPEGGERRGSFVRTWQFFCNDKVN